KRCAFLHNRYDKIGGIPNTTPTPTARSDLPRAIVTVNHPADVKLSKKRIRELLPIETQGFSLALARLGEKNLINYLQEQGYFFADVSMKCEPVDCSGPFPNVIYEVLPGSRLDLQEIRIEGTDEL